MNTSEMSGLCLKTDELLEIPEEVNRVPRELEDEINKVIETVEKSETGCWSGNTRPVGMELICKQDHCCCHHRRRQTESEVGVVRFDQPIS